jgi:exopolyphosphatase / guanosine-5'-triphosphate,3'-diphosphate pyrophosphatase
VTRARRPGSRAAAQTLAALDLGSNSFHMVVAQVVDGLPRVVDRLRERVVLAAGFDKDDRLDEATQARALACLERFGQRLRTIEPDQVRAVGTNALRRAHNARELLKRGQAALGHPIEVISGQEEARLIYLGVAHDLADDGGRRLVVDIGGGSTECIVGEGFATLQVDSLFMGCVASTLAWFPGGQLKKQAFARAEMAARLEIEPIERRYRSLAWTQAVGSSGTILSIEEVLRGNGWARGGITRKGLERLKTELLRAKRIKDVRIEGLKEERAEVLPGGLAILLALFEGFGIQRMGVSQGALREGLLYDMLGRIRHEDVREQTIRGFVERFHVDAEHVAAVERTALAMLEQVEKAWELEGEEERRLLVWAARLHEIGVTLSYTGYHKHGAYLVAHSDMRGFSRPDQQRLAALIRNHRRRITDEHQEDLPGALRTATRRLTLLLRLAVRLNRARTGRAATQPRLTAKDRGLALAFPHGWLDARPMTRADLEEEAAYFEEAGYRLEVR